MDYENNAELQALPWFQGLFLFKELVKMGCEWQGDVFSKKWSECLILTGDGYSLNRVVDVREYLAYYREGIDYKIEGDFDSVPFNGVAIWIA